MTDPLLGPRGLLRSRLVKLEGELIEKLTREEADGGFLAVLGRVSAALHALDRMPVEAEPAVRAVVSDGGVKLQQTLYAATGAVAAVELDPIRAVELASRRIEAALPRVRST